MFDKFKRLSDVEKIESEFQHTMDNVELEKSDTLAMMMAAFLVFIPGILVIITVFCGIMWLLFLR